MFLSWWKQRKRRILLAQPAPRDWLAIVERNLPAFRYLSFDDRQKLIEATRVFVAEKYWEGCGGLELTDQIRVTIAAHVCLMSLGLTDEPWRQVLSVLVYPTAYAVPAMDYFPGGAIEGHSARSGESWYRGPVVLSWADIERDIRHSGQGRNLVWHEFAHQLDMLDRSTNGTPPLEEPAQRQRWHDVMTAEYEQLIDAAETGRATLLDTYGAENEAEFFAVASECFFDCPAELHARHGALYDLLGEYYRQDPAARLPR